MMSFAFKVAFIAAILKGYLIDDITSRFCHFFSLDKRRRHRRIVSRVFFLMGIWLSMQDKQSYGRNVILRSQEYLALKTHQLRITCRNNAIFFIFIFRNALN